MAKNWVVTLQPTDGSSPKRIVEKVNGRKKIAEVEEVLAKLYHELTAKEPTDLAENVTRLSGMSTRLEKPPYIFEANLLDV